MIFAKAPTAAGKYRRAVCVKRSHIATLYYTTFLQISQYPNDKFIPLQSQIHYTLYIYYINKRHTATATATPQRIPAKKRSGPRDRFFRFGKSIPLSSRMRFASFSISSRELRLGLISRRRTKYASSKYRLSPVLTTIICFCAPFITSAPPFGLFGRSICQSFSKKPRATQKTGKKDAKKHDGDRAWERPSRLSDPHR